MKTLSILVSLAVARSAFAQTTSPYIPAGISSSCTAYLEALNSDSSIQTCLNTIVTATASFAPGVDISKISSSTLSSTLSALCAPGTGCSSNVLRIQLTKFYAACAAELTGTTPVDDVVAIYDTLYTLYPLQHSVCALDDNQKYCLLDLGSVSQNSTSSSTNSTNLLAVTDDSIPADAAEATSENLYSTLPKRSLSRRDAEADFLVNLTTIEANNALYLFTSSSQPASVLCTTCTKNILAAYESFEEKTPNAVGIYNSQLLNGQVALWQGISDKCGQNFINSINVVAGANSNSTSSAVSVLLGRAGEGFGAVVGALVAAMLVV